MMNANSSRAGAPEPSLTRPEPRVARRPSRDRRQPRAAEPRGRPKPEQPEGDRDAPRCWAPHCDSAANCRRRKT